MSAATLERKSERIEARVTPAEKNVIETAAHMRGETMRDFVISSAKEQAVRIIREMEILTLTGKSREVFINALLNPPEPTADALRAVKRYRRHQQEKVA